MTRVEREEIRAAQRSHNITFRQASDLVNDLHAHEKAMGQKLQEIRARRAKEKEAQEVQPEPARDNASQDGSGQAQTGQ